jgi:hypothetical protein
MDRRTGLEEQLERPLVGGWLPSAGVHSVRVQHLIETPEGIAKAIPIAGGFDPDAITRDGRGDVAERMLDAFGGEKWPLVHVASPLWCTYSLWGFEGMMTTVAARPELVEHACERYLALQLRAPTAADYRPSALWRSRCREGLVRVNPEHADFPALLAEVLDLADARLSRAPSRRHEESHTYLLFPGADADLREAC